MHWLSPLTLTLELMASSVLVAATLGITLAFCLSLIGRQRFAGRLIRVYCLGGIVAALATPMVLHAAAWEATAGKFGWLTFSQTAARTYTGFAGQYGGMVACVWVHGLIGSGIVALATHFGTSRVQTNVLDQGHLDGGVAWRWWMIQLPIASPWVMVGLLITAILAATEMTVVDLYGVRTLADEFYLFHAANPTLESVFAILVLPCVLVIALATAFVFARRRAIDVSLFPARGRAKSNRGPDWQSESGILVSSLASIVSILLSTLMFAFPLAGLVLKTGQTIAVNSDATATVSWSPSHALQILAAAPAEFAAEYQWTLLIGLFSALMCTPIGWAVAAGTRSRPKLQLAVNLVF